MPSVMTEEEGTALGYILLGSAQGKVNAL